MKTVEIKNITLDNMTHLVELASKVEGPGVIVNKGNTAIDGSSLMGMMALDTSKGFEITYPISATEFDNFIQTLI